MIEHESGGLMLGVSVFITHIVRCIERYLKRNVFSRPFEAQPWESQPEQLEHRRGGRGG